jgi:hypothetical protein
MAENHREYWQMASIAAACFVGAAVLYYMVPAKLAGCWIVFGLLVTAGLAFAVAAVCTSRWPR